jgi:hypothetical protein
MYELYSDTMSAASLLRGVDVSVQTEDGMLACVSGPYYSAPQVPPRTDGWER